MFELLSSVQFSAQRINYRLKTLYDKLGSNNSLVEDLTAKLDILLPNNYRFKNGVPQIIKPGQIYKDAELNKNLYGLESEIPTWQSVKNKFVKSYEEYLNEPEEFESDVKITLEQYINVNMELPKALTVMYTNEPEAYARAGLNIMHIKGRRKTYEELYRAINDAKISERKMAGQYNDYKVGISKYGV